MYCIKTYAKKQPTRKTLHIPQYKKHKMHFYMHNITYNYINAFNRRIQLRLVLIVKSFQEQQIINTKTAQLSVPFLLLFQIILCLFQKHFFCFFRAVSKESTPRRFLVSATDAKGSTKLCHVGIIV